MNLGTLSSNSAIYSFFHSSSPYSFFPYSFPSISIFISPLTLLSWSLLKNVTCRSVPVCISSMLLQMHSRIDSWACLSQRPAGVSGKEGLGGIGCACPWCWCDRAPRSSTSQSHSSRGSAPYQRHPRPSGWVPPVVCDYSPRSPLHWGVHWGVPGRGWGCRTCGWWFETYARRVCRRCSWRRRGVRMRTSRSACWIPLWVVGRWL